MAGTSPDGVVSFPDQLFALARGNEAHTLHSADDTIAACGLCFIEPLVGSSEERFIVPAIARAMADANTDGKPALGITSSGSDTPTDALGQRPRVVDSETIGNNNKFLAAESVCEIRHARGRDHIEHDALEDHVAGRVTETAIEFLEVIDIDQQ